MLDIISNFLSEMKQLNGGVKVPAKDVVEIKSPLE
jgi:hypothetical protein